jgi:hypothetical protein
MCKHMGMQIGLLIEALVTALKIAQERLLSCVYP